MIDDFARHHDDLAHRHAFEEAHHLRLRAGQRFSFILRGIDRELDGCAQLAIDLHRQRCRIAQQGGRIHRRPRLVFQHALGMTQHLPQRVTDVRHDRIQQQHHGLQCLVAYRAALFALVVEFRQRVEQFHQGGDRRVERVAPTEVIADLLDGFVQLAAQCFLTGVQVGGVDDGQCLSPSAFGTFPCKRGKGIGVAGGHGLYGGVVGAGRVRGDLAPKTLEEAGHAFNAGFAPFQ